MDYGPRSVLMTTDYPLDKVIYQHVMSITVPAFDFNDVVISHGLSFDPLIRLQWSTSADFSTAFGTEGGPRDPIGFPAYRAAAESLNGNITVRTNNRTGSSVTLYIRMFGFMPSNINDPAPSTVIQGSDFAINTDNNYMKLYSTGVTPIPAGTNTRTVEHNLSYKPSVLLWADYPGIGMGSVDYFYYSTLGSTFGTYATITDNQIIYTSQDNFASFNMHHRIYIDEA